MFDIYKQSERWTRSKADSKGFREWRRNAVGALIGTAIQFLIRYRFMERGAAVSNLVVSLAVFASLFVLFPLFELAWNYLRAPVRIAVDEIKHYKTENARLKIVHSDAIAEFENKLRIALDVATSQRNQARLNEWKELYESFTRIDDTYLSIQIDSTSDSKEKWSLISILPTTSARFNLLASHGGNLLKTSPHFFLRHPKLENETDPARLWFKALYYDLNVAKARGPGWGIETHPESGQTVRQYYFFEILRPAWESQNLCTKILLAPLAVRP